MVDLLFEGVYLIDILGRVIDYFWGLVIESGYFDIILIDLSLVVFDLDIVIINLLTKLLDLNLVPISFLTPHITFLG